jgi:integrase
MRLTKTVIDAARPRERQYILWDRVGGFGCTVFAPGKRSFMLRYRLPGSRQRYERTIGPYGEWTVEQARSEAERMLQEIRGQQRHPVPPARTATDVLTVNKLVEQYAAGLRTGTANTKRLRGRAAAPGYLADNLRQLERFAAAYGTQAATAITRRDVATLLNEYIDQPSVHRRLHGAISRMYTWALQGDLVTINPADHVETTSPPARERVLTLEELTRIWRGAVALEPLYRDLVQLLILTGQRRDEIAGMTWGEIAPGLALWVIPPGRTKARRQHTVPLPSLAQEILQARHAVFGKREPAKDDLVLPSIARDGKSIAPVSGWNWLKRELDRLSGVQDWRLHDFRRSIVSICAEHGADVAVLDSLLNHASSATRGGVIGTYQRALLIEPIRKVMALWDGLLRAAIGLAPAPERAVVRLVSVERPA